MKKEIIKDGNNIIAIILKNGDFPEDLNFHNSNDDYLIVATWNHKLGRKTKRHNHIKIDKIAKRTQEMVYIKKGKAKVDFYGEKDNFIQGHLLEEGDILISLGGGHQFEIWEEGTQAIEVRNGSYLGEEKDRRIF